MRKILVAINVILSAQMCQAEDCGELGLTNSELAAYFCDKLKGISGSNSATRGILGSDIDASDDIATAPEEWPDVEVLQDAYRTDPKKTLELIARIKKAGGLTAQ